MAVLDIIVHINDLFFSTQSKINYVINKSILGKAVEHETMGFYFNRIT